MKSYCGTDIIEVERVKKAIINTKGFKEKIYSPLEIECGEAKGEASVYEYYAGRFAAKESVYKALSNIDSEIEFKNIEILNDKKNKNRPFVNILKSNIANMQKSGELKIDVSISHIKEYANSVAVVEHNA